MSGDARLSQIVSALEDSGIKCLVMGGHAVRYYGLNRYTNDFDLHLSPDAWNGLAKRLQSIGLFGEPPEEGPSWRPKCFRRFRVGTLADGREEWLDCWRANHLLAPFREFVQNGHLGDTVIVGQALKGAKLAITQSLLLPFCPEAPMLGEVGTPMEPVVLERLRTVEAGSPLHFALVEIVRRQHRHVRQAADRREKELAHDGNS